jgi:hypothetical protein
MRRLAVSALVALVLAPASSARPLLGVLGNPTRFHGLTGQDSTVVEKVVGWNQGLTWGSSFGQLFATMGDVPLLGITMDAKGSSAEAITPLEIARGGGDAYLVALNGAIATWNRRIYVRPFFEADGFWSTYCAFTRSGRSKGPAHSTAAFRKAFARTYLILHGGPAASIDAAMRRLGMPPLRGGDLPANPVPRLKVIWNPQAYAVPELAANQPERYYPGPAYVDVVGNDIYGQPRIKWREQEAYYKRYAGKPFAIPEWGLWGRDDPQYVRDMAHFARTHRRLELLVYANGKPGSLFDLALRPRSRTTYRSLITPLAG